MDSSGLTAEQADRLQQQAARHLSFVRRLVDRMDALGFALDDPVYAAASKAAAGLGELERHARIRAGNARRRAGHR